MPEPTSPYDELIKTNEAYHEAVAEIFEDNVLPVEVKCKFGAYHNNLFQLMQQARDLIKPYYAPEPEE